MASLAPLLDEIAALLRAHGETHWSSWLAEDAERIRKGDPEGLRHFLSAFGGMGSLTDLVLCPENGHRIARSQVDAVNGRLKRLLDRAATLAREAKRKNGI